MVICIDVLFLRQMLIVHLCFDIFTFVLFRAISMPNKEKQYRNK